MENWKPGQIYPAGTVVLHHGQPYIKDDDTDQTEPDDVAGGWTPLAFHNLTQYQAIEASFSSYEQRVADHKAQVLAKLQAAGLEPDEVKAALGA